MVKFITMTDRDIHPRNADAEEDIKHRSTKASRERHDRETEFRDCDVRDKVAKGVSDGKDGETKDSIGDAEYDAKGFEDTNDFAGDGGDPGDGDGEAEEAEEGAVLGWVVGSCSSEEDEETD